MNSFKDIIIAIGISATMLSASCAEALEAIDANPSQTVAPEVLQGYTVVQQPGNVVWMKRAQHVAALGSIGYTMYSTHVNNSHNPVEFLVNLGTSLTLAIYLSIVSLPSFHGLYKSLINAPKIIPVKYNPETDNISSKYLTNRMLTWGGKVLFGMAHGMILVFNINSNTHLKGWARCKSMNFIVPAVLSTAAVGLNIAAEVMPSQTEQACASK